MSCMAHRVPRDRAVSGLRSDSPWFWPDLIWSGLARSSSTNPHAWAYAWQAAPSRRSSMYGLAQVLNPLGWGWARYMSWFVWALLGFWPFFPACAFVHTGAVAPLLRCAYLHAQSYIFIFSSLEKGMSNLLFGFPLLSTPKLDEALFFSFPHFQCNLIRLSTVPFTYLLMNSILNLWNILNKKTFVWIALLNFPL